MTIIYTGLIIIYNKIKKKEGYPIVEPNYYAHINESELRHIFRSDSKIEIPLVEQRVKILQETGKILLDVIEKKNKESLP